MSQSRNQKVNRNIKLEVEGRYEVSLPWIQNHPFLQTSRNVAERRLKNCVESLKKTGTLENFEAVLKEWIKGGVVEEIKDYCNDKRKYSLTHRAVITENSTTLVRPVFDGSNAK